MSKILIAILYASYHHRGQKRRHSGVPYIFHPLKTAIFTLGESNSRLTIAAILHDVIEDTKASEKTIQFLFGLETLKLIQTVSKNKIELVEEAHKMSEETLLLKTCDSLANLDDYIYWSGGCSSRKLRTYTSFLYEAVYILDGSHPIIEKLAKRTLLAYGYDKRH